ncbi:MAG: PqqD family protein [Oscillospiraceae bacterium]|nr:PqqD family protein [Oscillospiraceae bacterium]
MKLKPGFVTHNVGKEQMMVAAGPAARSFHGLVRSNETAAFIINCLKKETSEEGIVEAMLAEYEAPRETVEQDVHRIVEKLREIGALA